MTSTETIIEPGEPPLTPIVPPLDRAAEADLMHGISLTLHAKRG
jgi:hypothetical protein